MEQTRNNYDLSVMNGAMGIVTHVGRQAQLVTKVDETTQGSSFSGATALRR